MSPKEEARVRQARENKPWDITELFPSVSAVMVAFSGTSTGKPPKGILRSND